jgi:hypothetical protein
LFKVTQRYRKCATNNNNNNNKEAENIFKYKDLTIKIHRMWNVKTRVIPVIIGATGTISKSFRKYVSTIPENHEVKELQKTAVLGTAHILRKVLSKSTLEPTQELTIWAPQTLATE